MKVECWIDIGVGNYRRRDTLEITEEMIEDMMTDLSGATRERAIEEHVRDYMMQFVEIGYEEVA